jgi:hypothetical protein
MTITVPTAATLDRTAFALLDLHLGKIAQIADDLRRCELSGGRLRELIVLLELHAAGAQDELRRSAVVDGDGRLVGAAR